MIKWVLTIAILFAAYALVCGAPIDKIVEIARGADASVNRTLPIGYTNILLLGADSAQGGSSRSDTMMIASIGQTGDVKLTSVMRDTWVDIDGHASQKINAAYQFGGAELAMRTVNKAFAMNITRYVVIDYYGFGDTIDALGGIELDVTKEEMQAVNGMFGKNKALYLTDFGENTHLNGKQALKFARIRKLDSDYMRTARQRRVIEAILKKVKSLRDPVTIVRFLRMGLGAVKTNMHPIDLAAIGARALIGAEKLQQARIPFDNTYESGKKNGVWAIRADLKQNQVKLAQFIYG